MVCLDANVLIEIILDRKKSLACREFIRTSPDDLAITLLSLDLVMYYAERNNLELGPIERLVRTFLWLAITEADADEAFRHYAHNDFEDALQISCAMREGCTRFVTLDAALAKKYGTALTVTLL